MFKKFYSYLLYIWNWKKTFLFGFCPLCFDKTYQYHFFGQLVLTSHRQQGHLKTAPPFTVPYKGCAARFLHHRHWESNPGSLRGSPLHYRCTMPAPPSTINISSNFKIINTDESLVYSGRSWQTCVTVSVSSCISYLITFIKHAHKCFHMQVLLSLIQCPLDAGPFCHRMIKMTQFLC